ncbi:MAG: endonuclease/exonuclease/phosphatase family protein, partial [Myxococcales bacterium]|nr:endonuclease/exonuclease/phosphatase family protein [Myxococcales bacterium]
ATSETDATATSETDATATGAGTTIAESTDAVTSAATSEDSRGPDPTAADVGAEATEPGSESDGCSDDAPQTIRVVTWNIAEVGEPGSASFEAARAILGRLEADVVALNEIADVNHLEALMSAAGYSEGPVVAIENPFGDLRNAIISRLPLDDATVHLAAALSGDPEAEDVTRPFVAATFTVPGSCAQLTVIAAHFKAGWEPADAFRRAVEAARMGQVGQLAGAGGGPMSTRYLLVGDFNEEVDEGPHEPDPLLELPAGLPATFSLGEDLAALLAGPGLRNHPFFYLEEPAWGGAAALDAQQLDGDASTRIGSSRRIDYLMASPSLLVDLEAGALVTEVYNPEHEALEMGQGLPKYGAPLAPDTGALASDHHPVVADITLP